MDLNVPYEFIGFGAMDGNVFYEFVGFRAMDCDFTYELKTNIVEFVYCCVFWD